MTESEQVTEIRRLKAEQRAVVLAHNYQIPEVYQVADFIGDSLELARQAATANAQVIVFCGVRFMAETAKLLSPESRVILAEPSAGCEMATMIDGAALRARRQQLGDVDVVAYVNTTAEVKAESDICCTSANAVRIVGSIARDRRILFVPDQNLAAYVSRATGRDIVAWPGYCYVHAFFRARDVDRARREHPHAVVVSHPECPSEVLDASDLVASTGGMLRLAAEHREMVIGTEIGMCARIRLEYPDNRCFPLGRTAICRNMKLTSLKSIHRALSGQVAEVIVPEEVAERARRAIDRMLER